jgi:hypothetical protein
MNLQYNPTYKSRIFIEADEYIFRIDTKEGNSEWFVMSGSTVYKNHCDILALMTVVYNARPVLYDRLRNFYSLVPRD